MNKNLQKQLKVYTGVATAMLAAEKAKGQIVFQDFVPDSVFGMPPCASSNAWFLNIDLNGDSINDIQLDVVSYPFQCMTTFTYYDCSAGHIKISPLNGNLINNKLHFDQFTYTSSSHLRPAKLATSDTIDFSGYWFNSPNQFIYDFLRCYYPFTYHTQRRGAWLPGSDGYLPFAISKNGSLYFGWLHLYVINRATVSIKSYAYNTIPNAPIIAGDTTNASLVVNEINSGFSISQHNSNVLIISDNSIWNVTIKVFDLLGKEILTKNFSGNQTEINIDKKGIFIVEVSSEKNVMRKKIYVY